MQKFFKEHWLLIGILVIAAFFRFWQIGHLPGGLFPDEAANGLDINSILNGHLKPFYERGNGREALFFYFLTASVALFGRGVWQHHIISAGFGVVEILVAYLLAKRLFGKNVALLTTFFMAISSYMVTVNRTAFRANLVPLFAMLTILFLVKFFQVTDKKQKIYSAFFAGLSFGLGFYTYISFRMMPFLLLALACFLLWSQRDRLKQLYINYKKPSLIFVVGFILAFSWLGIYFVSHPGSFIGRAGGVSIFNKDLNQGDAVGTFITVFKKTILAFFTQGDLNWRQNVAGFPFLPLLLSPFFAVSLIIFTYQGIKFIIQAVQKKVEPQTVYKALVAAWFWLMLVPEITTAEGIPHGLRLTGVIPVMFILPAWSINKVWQKIKSYQTFNQTKYVFAGIFFVTLFIYNFYLYFVVAASSPDYYYAFRSDLTTVSNYLSERNEKSKTYLSLDAFSVQTVDYLTTTTNNPYILLDPANTYKVSLKKGDQVVFTQSTLYDRLKFTQSHPKAKLIEQEKNQFGQIIMLVYEQP